MPEISRNSMSPRERELRSRAAQLLDHAGLLHGFVVEREKSCGRRGCHCEQPGQRHPALYVYRRQQGRLRQLYVPKSREQEVRRWVERDRELRALLEEIWEIHWQRAKAGRAKKKEA